MSGNFLPNFSASISSTIGFLKKLPQLYSFFGSGSFLALTSFGLEGTYIKYVAEFYARKEFDRINRLLSTGLLLTIVVSTIILLVLWIAMPLLISTLRIEEELGSNSVFNGIKEFSKFIG